MLHRVSEINNNGIIWNENMKVSPQKLDALLSQYVKKYDIIRLEDVPDRMRSNCKRRFVVFTMDDGYRDNLTEALPIFKKHNVPYTIFLTTDFMDRKAILWWYTIEQMLLKYDNITLSNGVTYHASTFKEKCDSFLKIREVILTLDPHNLLNELKNLFNQYDVDWFNAVSNLALSWDDVTMLKKEPLVTLGAHTQHHYNLKKLRTQNDISKEVMNGYNILERKAEIQPSVFAYPFGSISEADEREFETLRCIDPRIKLAVCSCGGPVTSHHTDLFSLPRIMMDSNFNSLSLLRTKNVVVI